jgi:hypothetical protein
MVRNNDLDTNASQVFSLDYLSNYTFFYDELNEWVYLSLDLTYADYLNWSIEATSEELFDILLPQYLEVGDYFFSSGMIYNSSGDRLNAVVTTKVLLESGTQVLYSNHYCVEGNYLSMFSTNTLEAGIYCVSIEFTDPETSEILYRQSLLYLSVDPASGIYVSTNLHFTFYDNNTGIGLPLESFKVYVSEDTDLTGDRLYVDTI